MERRGAVIKITLAVFLVCLLQLYPLNNTRSDYLANDNSHIDSAFEKTLIVSAPLFVLGTTKKYAPKKFCSYKCFSSKSNSRSRGKVGIFTGKEAKIDHAIFEILVAYGPLSIRELLKLLNTYGLDIPYYSSLYKRIHALVRGRYIRQVHASSVGSKAMLYEALPLFYLARFLNINGPDEILSELTQTGAVVLLADFNNPDYQIGQNNGFL